MFGGWIQTQFSVFESKKWWARVHICLFGNCSQFLYFFKNHCLNYTQMLKLENNK